MGRGSLQNPSCLTVSGVAKTKRKTTMPSRFVLPSRDPLIRFNPDIVENIMGLCNIVSIDENGCWLMPPQKWSKYSKRSVRVDETGARTQFYTHRISWVLQYGSIDPGKMIRHQCHNTLCSNPSHLLLGSAAANLFDRLYHQLVMEWFGNRQRPNVLLPHISLWPGWGLPEYQEAYERICRFAEAAVADEAAE